MKITYIPLFLFSNIIISNNIYSLFFHKIILTFKSNKKIPKPNYNYENLELLIGYNEISNTYIKIPEYGLYQNFFVIGSIGSGKTSSAMLPFTYQLLTYNNFNLNKKIGMLVLDVKGNFHSHISDYIIYNNLNSDLIVISLNSNVFYNPLHKPNLKAQILSSRLKTILLLFSKNNTESFWIDKAEEILTELIKLCRIYNDNYVTFSELHNLITNEKYLNDKISTCKDLFFKSKIPKKQLFNFNTSISFFTNEFANYDSRTKNLLVSEITRITNVFISDSDVSKTFCPPKQQLTFSGFEDVIKNGKIVILNINIAEYGNLSKIIAAYLKLDFQSEILKTLSSTDVRTTAFICDEYDKFATPNDSDFFSLSREAKCINIISSQSYSSLKNSIQDDTATKVIIQNLINKIWYRTDDIFTIEEIQKQLGKEDKQKISKSISENAKESKFSYIFNTFNSKDSSISETYSIYLQNDYIFDYLFFTQKLETFSALAFLSNGNIIIKPHKLNMIPYFKKS